MSIRAAILEIAYDNGGIRSNCTEEQCVTKVMQKLSERFTATELQAAEVELRNLSEDELEELCIGEEGDRPMVLLQTQDILTAIFESV